MDPRKLKPINGQIVIKDDEKTERVGTIYIPETAEEKRMKTGVILAVSNFMLEDGTILPSGLEPGNKVCYPIHAGAGNTFEVEKSLYRIIRWNEVLAVIP